MPRGDGTGPWGMGPGMGGGRFWQRPGRGLGWCQQIRPSTNWLQRQAQVLTEQLNEIKKQLGQVQDK